MKTPSLSNLDGYMHVIITGSLQQSTRQIIQMANCSERQLLAYSNS